MKEYKKLTIFLICVVSLKVAFAFLAGDYSYFSLRDFFTSVLNTENIVSLTNESRKAAGLNELKVNQKLVSAAQKKAEDMLKNQYFSHTGSSGKSAWDFLDDANYKYLFAGENLAMNFESAEEVMDGWLASLKHKENILDKNYTQIGIGIATGKFLGVKTTVIVQMFGKPLRSASLIGNVSSAVKKSKKILASKRPMKLVEQTTGLPAVKGTSIKEYISKLVQNNVAEWMPSAKTNEIYVLSDSGILTKSLLDMLFAYIVACGIGIFAWRFFKEKYYRNKRLGAYTFLVIAISLVLLNL